MLSYCCARLNQLLLDFFNLDDLQLIFTRLWDPINLLINVVQLWAFRGHSWGRRKLRVIHCSSWTVLHAQRASVLSCWKTKLLSATCLVAASGAAWDRIYPSNAVKKNSCFWYGDRHRYAYNQCLSTLLQQMTGCYVAFVDVWCSQSFCKWKRKEGKEEYLYSAFLHQGTLKALRRGSHSFTCKQHHACLSFVAFTRCRHDSNCGSRHPIAAHYSFIDPERMKGWVGLVGWLTADGLPT